MGITRGVSSFVVWMQVLYYSTQVFAAAGVKNGDIATVVVVAMLVVFTLITVRWCTLPLWYMFVLGPFSLPPFLPPSLPLSFPLLPSSFPFSLLLFLLLLLLPPPLLQAFLIDVVGRRTLMLYGLGGMTVFFTLFTSMFCFQVLTQ